MSSVKTEYIIKAIYVGAFTCVFVLNAINSHDLYTTKERATCQGDPFRLIFLFCRLHRPEMIGEILRLGTVDQVEENIPCLFVSLDVAAVVVLWVVRIGTEYFLFEVGQLLFGV